MGELMVDLKLWENEIGLIFKIYIKELCGEVLLSEVSVILYVLSDF